MKYRSKYFVLQELVPPEVFTQYGERAWEFLDPYLLLTLDQLREQFGPITINDWHTGGEHKESGLRVPTTLTGAAFSQHKFGRAGDCKFKNTTPAGASAVILSMASKFPFLTCMEDVAKTVTWLHVDVRNSASAGILIVEP